MWGWASAFGAGVAHVAHEPPFLHPHTFSAHHDRILWSLYRASWSEAISGYQIQFPVSALLFLIVIDLPLNKPASDVDYSHQSFPWPCRPMTFIYPPVHPIKEIGVFQTIAEKSAAAPSRLEKLLVARIDRLLTFTLRDFDHSLASGHYLSFAVAMLFIITYTIRSYKHGRAGVERIPHFSSSPHVHVC
jgi:hypothetical protein